MDDRFGGGLSQKVAAALQRVSSWSPVVPAIGSSGGSQNSLLAKYWHERPDFSAPAMSPQSSRPPTGPRPFTLICERLSKGVNNQEPLAAYISGRSGYAGRATAISRNGAARKSDYLVGAVSLEVAYEPRDPEKGGSGASEYISRRDAVETFNDRSVETNIPGGSQGRREFWKDTSDNEDAARAVFERAESIGIPMPVVF